MAAHHAALPGAVDHLPAIGRGRTDRREGEDRLLGVGEVNRETVLRGGLCSAGGLNPVDGALQRRWGYRLKPSKPMSPSHGQAGRSQSQPARCLSSARRAD